MESKAIWDGQIFFVGFAPIGRGERGGWALLELTFAQAYHLFSRLQWKRRIQKVSTQTFFDFQQRQQTVLSPRSSIWNASATFSFSFWCVLFTHSSSFLGFEGTIAEITRYTTTEVVTTNGTSCTHSLPESFRNPPNVEGIGSVLR